MVGIESTFLAEPEKFARILLHYYRISTSELGNVKNRVMSLNEGYVSRVKMATDEINSEFETHYNRQKDKRQEKIYNDFDFRDVLKEIDTTNIQNIMTKKIMRLYLADLHTEINRVYTVIQITLTAKTIFDAYYNSISNISDTEKAFTRNRLNCERSVETW